MDAIRVGALLDDKKFDLRLTLVAGKQGLSRRISSARIQKPGLVLAGYTEYLHKERVQVFGNTEMSYLSTLPRDRAVEVLRNFFGQDVACLVDRAPGGPPDECGNRRGDARDRADTAGDLFDVDAGV